MDVRLHVIGEHDDEPHWGDELHDQHDDHGRLEQLVWLGLL